MGKTVNFTVIYDGEDVTSDVSICMDGDDDTPLTSAQFSTDEAGVYRFYASMTDNEASSERQVSNTATVYVVEEGGQVSVFHKNVTFFTFTATWCSPCTTFKGSMHEMMEDYGDNMVAVNIYSGTEDNKDGSNPKVSTPLSLAFLQDLYGETLQGFGGWPTSYVDLTSLMLGAYSYEQVKPVYVAQKSKPAKTGISVNSTVNGSTVTATVTIAAEAADTYFIGALLVEDSVVCYQEKVGNEYVHTGVLRASSAESIFGEELGTMSAGDMLSKDYTFTIESGYNQANLSLVIYTLYEGANGKKVIANSVKAPIRGFTDFKYAE